MERTKLLRIIRKHNEFRYKPATFDSVDDGYWIVKTSSCGYKKYWYQKDKNLRTLLGYVIGNIFGSVTTHKMFIKNEGKNQQRKLKTEFNKLKNK